MQLYNTLHKKVESFSPKHQDAATIYSCGPTVYDHAHIGNLRAFIGADLLRRAIQNTGIKVHHTMNFTDVDDKMIARSRENYPDDSPEEALKQLGQTYEQIFRDDMQAIGNDINALDFVRATESIKAMQVLITELYKAGAAYIADDGVYFSIAAYRKTGKTYGQLVEITQQSTDEARINNDDYDKESAHDFALWKTQKPNEPGWDFELDGHNLLGRPGWHIECSAMSTTSLGQPFDIHTGGIDLIFPHHENEIAQSTAITEDPLYARYFVHNEHLLVEGRKMSKSLNNFFTLRDIQEKGFDPLAYRLLTMQAHYRTQLNFSWDNLEAAQARLQRWRNTAVLRFQPTGGEDISKQLQEHLQAATAAVEQDLDTPTALAQLESVFDFAEKGLPKDSVNAFNDVLSYIDTVLGFDLLQQDDIPAEAKTVLDQRQAARDAKDWELSDKLRDQLLTMGVAVRDTSTGQIWSYSAN